MWPVHRFWRTRILSLGRRHARSLHNRRALPEIVPHFGTRIQVAHQITLSFCDFKLSKFRVHALAKRLLLLLCLVQALAVGPLG